MKKPLLIVAATLVVGCSEDEVVTRPLPDAAPADVTGDTSTPPMDTAVDASDAVISDTASDVATDAPTDLGTDTSVDGGTEKDCIDGSAMAPFFTVEDASKCLVARYDVATASLGTLTWGRHGGPLGFRGGSPPALLRYEVPAAATGTIAVATKNVTVPSVPSGAFWGSQAVDLPFFGWTAFSYTTSTAGFAGEVLLVGPTDALQRYHVNGFFSAVGVGLTSTSGGRLIHTALSPIAKSPSTSSAGALYAADSCGSAATTPRLLPEGESGCKDPIKVATWEAGSSGPVAADPDENVFAILSKFGGKQELRGFERSTIVRGAGPTSGTMLFSLDGYTNDLAADGKTVFYQPNDATTFSALDVMALAYTVDAGAKKVSPKGASTTFLKMTKPGTSVSLVVDDKRRLWVGVTVPASGDAGATSSMLFVLRDKNP